MRGFKNQILSRKGVVLILVVAAIAVMLIMSVAMARLGFQSRLLTIRTAQEQMARSAADAGHNRALFELNYLVSEWTGDLPYPDPDPAPLTGTNQTYTYTISQPDPAPAGLEGYLPYVYDIEAAGWAGEGAPKMRKISSTVILTGSFDFAMFVNTTLEVKNSGSVDGYAGGKYGPGNSGNPVRIGTNSGSRGAVILKRDADIAEDSTFHVGNFGKGVSSASEVLTGQGAASIPEQNIQGPTPQVDLEVWEMPDDPPGDTESTSAITVKTGKELCLDCDGTYVYKGIRVKTGAVLRIEGPGTVVIKVGSKGIKLDNGSTLDIDANASVVFYLDGDFTARNGSTINTGGTPADLKILGAAGCEKIVIHNDGDFSGVVHAANAELDIKNSGDVFGSFSGDSAVIRNSGGFHYDESLRNVEPGDLGAHFTVVRWREE